MLIMICLIVTIVIDTSIIKIYDLSYKYFVSMQNKIILFAVNSSLCLLLQCLAIYYIRHSVEKNTRGRRLGIQFVQKILVISLAVLGTSLAILTIQMYYNASYDSWNLIFIISFTYGTASVILIILCKLFVSWYKVKHDLLVLLYFISILIIVINFVVTALYTCINIIERPSEVREFVGGSMDVTVGRHIFLDALYSVFSIASFGSMWAATVVLMKDYRSKLINAVTYWIILSLPLIYFLLSTFYKLILTGVLIQYLTVDPITVSIILTAVLSLSKPIGGLTFGIVFWKISRTLSYERNIQTFMIISGWGILLIFGTNQGVSQSLDPYPPFGLYTNSVLILAAYLTLLGIHNAATLVSVNIDLRKSIHRHALESKLLDLIGRAEMNTELQRTVDNIIGDKNLLGKEEEGNLDLDEDELKKHLDFVIKELKK
jgi:hypothetical protein